MNRLFLGVLVFGALCSGVGCGDDDDERLGDGDADADSDADSDGDSDADGDADGDANAEALVDGVVRGLADAVALTAPMRGDGATLFQQRDRANEGDVHNLVENAVARDSVVTDGGCTTFAWDGLSVTITFDACTAEETGLPLDGSLTLAVSINPTTFSFTFTDLTIGTTSIAGSLSLAFTGGGDLGGTARQTVNADLTIDDVHLVLTDLQVAGNGAAYTLSGTGSIQTPAVDADLTFDQVAWNTGDCRPSGGSVAFSSPGLTGTAEFLPTTPADGVVRITIPPLPSFDYTLPACTE